MKEIKKVRRLTMAVTLEEERALRWKAREMGLVDFRGRPKASLVIRDYSLKAVVAEYDKRPQ